MALDLQARWSLAVNEGPGVTEGGSTWRTPRVVGGALLLAGAVVFGPALRVPWLWDDHTLIRESPVLGKTELLPTALRSDFWAISANPRAPGMYRPLVTASYFADRAIFGTSPVGPHAVNLGLHALSVLLLVLLARRLRASPLEALLSGALFGFHPVVVEAIANVSSRGDLLATGFMLGGMWAWRREGLPAAIAGSVLFGLAQLSKEAAFVALPLALLLDWWASGFTVDLRRWVRFAAPSLLVTAAVLGLRRWALGSAVHLAAESDWVPMFSGATTAARYAFRVVWPWPLVPYQAPTSPSVLAGLGLFVAVLGALAFASRGRPMALLVCGWFLIATAPVTGWLPLPVRFSGLLLYLPLTGLSIFAARVLTPVRVGWALPAAGAALCLAIMPMWSSASALWEANVEACPELVAPRLNLANALVGDGRDAEALEVYLGVVRLALAAGDLKSLARAELGLGNLVRPTDPTTAEGHYRRSLEASGQGLWQAGINLSVSLFQQGKREEAAAALEAQWKVTPFAAVAAAGLRLAQERGDTAAQVRWRARVSGHR